MTRPKVTGVGRMLKPKGDEPIVIHRITVDSKGTVKTTFKAVDQPA